MVVVEEVGGGGVSGDNHYRASRNSSMIGDIMNLDMTSPQHRLQQAPTPLAFNIFVWCLFYSFALECGWHEEKIIW